MLREVLTVSALILAVLLVRAIFKNRVPKRMVYALWLVVLVKLCLPGTLVSLPILPAEETAAPVQRVELPAQTAPVVLQPAQAVVQPQVSAQQPVSPAQEAAEPAAKPLTAMQIFQIIWAGGSALLGLWLLGTWLVFAIRLHKSRRFLSKRGGTRIYVSSAVKSPCLAGLIPAVYLTGDVLQTDEAELILSHELTHLCHLDFLWSFCRAAAVSVYWWNPFIWVAAICSKHDAELACDEAVAAKLPESKRLAYARAILAQAPRKTAALSLAGPPVKERILFLTKKQRTSVLCVILALLLIVSAAGCSITELTRQKTGEITLPKETPVMEEPTDTPEPADTPIEQEEPIQEPQTQMLPTPASSMFGLTGREAVLFDAAVAQRYPRDDNDIVLPSLLEYGSFEENGKTVVICYLHYDFYYDYTGPDWEWNGGGSTTVARFELDAPGNICTGFAEYPSGSLSDWIRDFCGPLAVQNADGAWVLPETSGDWFPAVENPFQQYLEVIASTAPSSDAPAAASLSEDMIWEYVHEKLDYAHWAQDMTAEYEDIVRKFQIEDSKMSDLPGDISQWPRYYSAFIDYFSAANADLRYLDADTIWTKGLSEDQQSLIVTMTRADVVLTLSYSLQTSQITEVSTRRNAVLQSVTGDSITAEHITLLNASLEEDLQTLKALNIPPQNYYYGYYRVDSGELYTYKVDPNASVTIYDIEQEYGAGEDRLYTFKTWRDFVAAAQENEGLLVQPYTLTLKNGVVVKIEEKFYN